MSYLEIWDRHGKYKQTSFVGTEKQATEYGKKKYPGGFTIKNQPSIKLSGIPDFNALDKALARGKKIRIGVLK